MNDSDFQEKLIQELELELSLKVRKVQTPPQGMTSKVFFIETSAGNFAVKYGFDANNDIPAYKLIEAHGIEIPVPKLITSTNFQGIPVIVLEKLNYPLLETVKKENLGKYIPSMIENLRILHTIKSDKPGLLINTEKTKTWKEMLISNFSGGDLDWVDISEREGLDKELIISSVRNLIGKLNDVDIDIESFSLLHTDFNQRNLFVDQNSDQITGVIDWEEAMFGDPVYDLSRVRMFIWHFGLDNNVIQKYYELVMLSDDELKREELYWTLQVILYLAWYSEELNDFNLRRITLHQQYLREYRW